MIGRVVKEAFGAVGLDVRRAPPPPSMPVEFSEADKRTFDHIWTNKLTMGSRDRLAATILACRYAASLPGDFVECGTWRGGQSIAAKLTFEALGLTKKVFVFDTFAGMTEPSAKDGGSSTQEKFELEQRGDHNAWCYASLEDVRRNFSEAGADLSGVHFIKGDVRETLRTAAHLPEQISVLRLDTDFYDSTLVELEVLYPRLVSGGVLILDDYGHWEGARAAVDEYFAGKSLFLAPTDYTGRVAVKP